MLEGRKNQIIIEDISLDVMQTILNLLYNGDETIVKDMETAMQVLMVAEKYDMAYLKYIAYKMSTMMTVDDVLISLELADMHHAAKLQESCIRFITEHKSELSREQLKDLCLRKPELMFNVMLRIF